MASQLYWRKFTRDGSWDQDTLADDKFLAENFTDFFGKWLQTDKNAEIQTFDGVVMKFWSDAAYNVDTFMVADAGIFDHKKYGEWFRPHARVLSLVTLAKKAPFSSNTNEWTLCIVGGSRPKDLDGFLQVMSWDGSTFRYYQRDQPNRSGPKVWNYFGQSRDAFEPDTSYLGPFNGHVNGGPIMKELHDPWIHWFGGETHEFKNSFPDEIAQGFREVPYITKPDGSLLSALNMNPNVLEKAIKKGLGNWFITRRDLDFFKPDDKGQPNEAFKLKEKPSNITRWVSHLFLTTTINIGGALYNPTEDKYRLPMDHFYDRELLSLSFTDLMPPSLPKIQFADQDYRQAVANLGLSLLFQVESTDGPDVSYPLDVLGGDKRDPFEPGATQLHFKKLLENTEGLTPFNILQASYEDSEGVEKIQTIKAKPKKDNVSLKAFIGLFSADTFNAIVMVDFWNPVYSWKRGVLMQYVPTETTFDDAASQYDLDARFISNVKNSKFATLEVKDSPEYEFLQLLNADVTVHRATIVKYLQAVQARMAKEPIMALVDYLTLAESRRRIYRPLPLDEFGPTMPFALKLDPRDGPLLKEMRPDGQIQDIPTRGQTFLKTWTNSLASVDPQILPQKDASSTQAPLAIDALPRPAMLAVPCQRIVLQGDSRESPVRGGCPFMSRKALNGSVSMAMTNSIEKTPNWTDDILPLIQSPYWVSGDAKKTGDSWVGAMKYWSKWDLSQYEDVRKRAVGIYQHLRSKSMPITRDPQDYWPEEALELFRAWANAGFPRDRSDFPSPDILIPKPTDARDTFKVRRDIISLSKKELAVYQSKLDEVLQVGALRSKWQELGVLHAYWCLHYQEATFLWHRAFLIYVEKLIGFPIPYWNGYTPQAADPQSKFAGIPPMFLEDKYKHPIDGEERPNPLKFALSLDGKSKDGTSEFVTRDPALTQGPSSPDWSRKIGLFKLYHEQISQALKQSTYTTSATAEGFGKPWANIPTFSDNQPDSMYPYRLDFDGLFEQVHDNFHGWVGPDMADNTYTAFDPIFLSYHANMDRLAGIFIDAHPENQFTSGFPLQPFINNGTDVCYDDPRRWRYTTIGDMAKDTRALGYMYGAPVSADAFTPKSAAQRGILSPLASGSQAISLPAGLPALTKATNGFVKAAGLVEGDELDPFVIFTQVGCTPSSYRIDVFTADARSLEPDILSNQDFVGQVTRLGMGPGRPGFGLPNKGRCRKPAATRILAAERVRERLLGNSAVQIVVTDLESGEQLSEGEYSKMPGLVPKVVWLPKSGSEEL